MIHGISFKYGRFEFEAAINLRAWGLGVATHVEDYFIGVAFGIGPVVFSVEYAR